MKALATAQVETAAWGTDSFLTVLKMKGRPERNAGLTQRRSLDP